MYDNTTSAYDCVVPYIGHNYDLIPKPHVLANAHLDKRVRVSRRSTQGHRWMLPSTAENMHIAADEGSFSNGAGSNKAMRTK